ncbi:hypothetical protein B0T14DRAFT_225735 [Immersiella caudata]|uniref:Uncharacterized protein n=1 Tax=Immersiella caudata TaxID=314043 RepID=A0AA39WRI2_9PEZI|nr:hypothetical protein B0T14DRAFT_225735 [Immersiella caudata]
MGGSLGSRRRMARREAYIGVVPCLDEPLRDTEIWPSVSDPPTAGPEQVSSRLGVQDVPFRFRMFQNRPQRRTSAQRDFASCRLGGRGMIHHVATAGLESVSSENWLLEVEPVGGQLNGGLGSSLSMECLEKPKLPRLGYLSTRV